MHYDFKQKLNKIDSQQHRNLRVHEIDWLLNEAIELFVKSVAFPRVKNNRIGFEFSQRTIDDIKALVKTQCLISNNNVTILPNDYQFFIEGSAIMRKEPCNQDKRGTLIIRKHYTDFELSPFDCTSYEWGVVNGLFEKNYIKTFAKDFNITQLCVTYVKKHPYVHNAEDSVKRSYMRLDNTLLTGTQDCILDDHTHREIVDLAVYLASTSLENPSFQIKQQKLNLNQTI